MAAKDAYELYKTIDRFDGRDDDRLGEGFAVSYPLPEIRSHGFFPSPQLSNLIDFLRGHKFRISDRQDCKLTPSGQIGDSTFLNAAIDIFYRDWNAPLLCRVERSFKHGRTADLIFTYKVYQECVNNYSFYTNSISRPQDYEELETDKLNAVEQNLNMEASALLVGQLDGAVRHEGYHIDFSEYLISRYRGITRDVNGRKVLDPFAHGDALFNYIEKESRRKITVAGLVNVCGRDLKCLGIVKMWLEESLVLGYGYKVEPIESYELYRKSFITMLEKFERTGESDPILIAWYASIAKNMSLKTDDGRELAGLFTAVARKNRPNAMPFYGEMYRIFDAVFDILAMDEGFSRFVDGSAS
jgi:hypothetical protein